VRVYSNTAVSLDGRIGTPDRGHVQVGTDEDRCRMSRLRAQADAVLVGGQTFRNWPAPLVELPEDASPRERPIINAVLTRQGVGEVDTAVWQEARLLVLAGEHAECSGLGQAEVLTHADPTPAWALDVLAERGCRSVLVEGGGDLIFQLLAAGRLDELYVTLCPRIIGGVGAPSLVDGVGFAAQEIQDLSLQSLDRVGDELYLHYTVTRGDSSQD